VAAKPGANWIQDDIARKLEQVGLALDEDGPEAAVEKVSFMPVAPVEPLRVHTVQPLHAERDVAVRRFDQEVIVVRHQAVRMASPFTQLDDLTQELEKPKPIANIGVDLQLSDAARRHVIDGTRCLHSRRSRHGDERSRGDHAGRLAGTVSAQ
jgi:hypothetical protein